MPDGLAMDALNLYYAHTGGPEIYRQSKSMFSGTAELTAGTSPKRLTVDANDKYLYYTNYGQGTVARVTVAGAAVTSTVVATQSGSTPWGIGLDTSGSQTVVYFADSTNGAIYRVVMMN